MEIKILNYTGKRLGVTNGSGNPIQVLPSHGNAKVEKNIKQITQSGRIPVYEIVYDRVEGLPDPDPNYEKMYIVNKDVANSVGYRRKDLLVAENPMSHNGTIFYRKLCIAS